MTSDPLPACPAIPPILNIQAMSCVLAVRCLLLSVRASAGVPSACRSWPGLVPILGLGKRPAPAKPFTQGSLHRHVTATQSDKTPEAQRQAQATTRSGGGGTGAVPLPQAQYHAHWVSTCREGRFSANHAIPAVLLADQSRPGRKEPADTKWCNLRKFQQKVNYIEVWVEDRGSTGDSFST